MNLAMKRRVFLELAGKGAGLLGLFPFSDGSRQDVISLLPLGKMKLESSAFVTNGAIPSRYTCDGQDLSPPLAWDEPPAGTRSFALICDDPDAPGKTWVHWVVYNLPPATRSLPEKVSPNATVAGGGLQGKNDFGKSGYGGPCPPSGTHRYFFKLYALDRVLELSAGATKARVEEAIKGHVLAEVHLIGLYHRGR
ncbi:YbhB/YbcL family Raf kinase inhibitor-like protein [Pannus brasiliensis CCIBt3594]|uniref:YbhB/YbcL family Raf kinase inhibitor-like protein n=1 Tax=Pannus brasiliensis CCIBt3594 TaxID=1427578 RepID=A0AAW9QUT0_9CHRO